ncbi:MAG TPA: HAMP domain-containing methyl-accepting chemotaxis protein [Alphaproteobacteria bacterium]|nr:HAMP domain-containing methyl-accepting chemotaxis protein [Alphaproteobacteria bacterium]
MLSNLKITSRLLIGFGLLVLAIAGLGSYSIYSAQDTSTILERVVRLKTDEALNERVLKRVDEGRVAMWKALATEDQSNWDKAAASFKIASDRLAELQAGTFNPQRLAAVKELRTLLQTYQDRAAVLKSFRGKNVALDTAEGKAAMAGTSEISAKIDSVADPLAVSYEGAAKEAANSAVESLAFSIKIAIVIGTLSVLLGIVLSWLVSRSISLPIKAMTAAMGTLAGGNTSIEIPAAGQKDEIGDMAKAVKVFKDNMIEADRLRADQEQAKARAEAEKRAAMNKMADEFESSVKGIVQMVSSASTELQTTAQSMSATAEETSRQSTAVAAASEQATTNVQTVASAAEELSSSIAEISRQVAESTRIAGQAVADADNTNAQVQALAEAAQKIGDVVKLINDIAGQTNLLALNATIEAARAGEAGKGFAVVASEVKSLATQTAKATEDISAQIKSIQGATTDSVRAIQGIGQTIGRINEIATTIASAVEEQGAATKEIARNVQQASAGTAEVSSNISGVTKAAGETGAASTQVLGAASELAKQSETLSAQVDGFIAKVRAA